MERIFITDPKEARKYFEKLAGITKNRRFNSGRRFDLGNAFFRSTWEANYARYLNFLQAKGKIVSWEYEPKRFYFPGYKRGTTSYLPDFKVWITKCSYEWHEVKGWRKQKGMTALKRMRKFYPEEKIVVVDGPAYRTIERQIASMIPYWERSSCSSF